MKDKQTKQWEEKENTLPKKKNTKHRKDGKWFITGETETKLTKRTKSDITKIKTKTEVFLQKLKDKNHYYDDYDYSKVNYISAFIKVIIIDKKYETEHLLTPSKMLNRGDRCSIKNSINKNEYIVKRAKLIHGNKYSYIDIDYKNGQTKVSIFCKEHNGFFEQTPKDHLNGRGCSLCNGGVQLTTEKFIIKSIIIHKNKYDYSEVDYKNALIKVKIFCKKHKGFFYQTPNSHLSGQNCPICGGKVKLTNETFAQKSEEIHGRGRYDYSDVNYKDNRTKVLIGCNVCNIKFEQTPGNHLIGKGCKKCANNALRYTNEEFLDKSKEIHGDRYIYPDEYKDTKTKIRIICRKHGIFKQNPSLHLSGKGCPICNLSKGELKIKNIFDNLEIKYEIQKTFNDCKNISLLRFDFYIPEQNLLIEYNGKQHYEPVKYWKHENDFKKRQLRDKIKLNYCKDNNIDLLILPYTEFDNIEQIIKNKINHEPILD